ncbi:MAG: trypsin-like peptidase domain-containing protein [Candidatus Colwellbacteria bacterium]|nr:trypsin-like peptidase domain-containing protein [Candidatus Colwellbacteria bacterium]
MEKKDYLRLCVIVLVGIIAAVVLSGEFPGRSYGGNMLDGASSFFSLLKENALPAAEEIVNSGLPSVPVDKPVVPYEAKLDYEEAVIEAVEAASPSVVSIVVSKDVPIIENCPVSPFGGLLGGTEFYVPCPSQSGKTETKKIGGGTGFVASADGLILTNKHVVSDKNASYTVFLAEGNEKYTAKVMSLDEVDDIAILKIEASGLKPLTLGNSDSVRLGQTAIAIGNALGEYKNTVSVGVISGKGRTVTASGPSGYETVDGVFQTDAAINPGNSGGPLLNLKGEVIGINTAVASGAENIGFSVPSNKVRRALDTYRSTGKIEGSYLGVRYRMTGDGAAISASDTGEQAVVSGSPAEKAGLKDGDIIFEADGKKLGTSRSLASVIGERSPGDTIDIKVRRGNEVLVIKVSLGNRN